MDVSLATLCCRPQKQHFTSLTFFHPMQNTFLNLIYRVWQLFGDVHCCGYVLCCGYVWHNSYPEGGILLTVSKLARWGMLSMILKIYSCLRDMLYLQHRSHRLVLQSVSLWNSSCPEGGIPHTMRVKKKTRRKTDAFSYFRYLSYFR